MKVFESAEKQLEYLTEFLEEQTWYTNQLIKDLKKKSQEEGHLKREILEAKIWILEDVKAVLRGEL